MTSTYHLDYPDRTSLEEVIAEGMTSPTREVRLQLTTGTPLFCRVTGSEGTIVWGMTTGMHARQVEIDLATLQVTYH